MKSRILTCAITSFAVLAMPVPLAAQKDQQQRKPFPGHTITDLGTMGGTFSFAGVVNNKRWVSGISTLPGDTAAHACVWKKGAMADLGTLGAPNSGGYPLNERGEVPGFSEIAIPDPLGEDFAVLAPSLYVSWFWQNGVITPALPTVGGNNGVAQEINNRGQAVGVAENTTHDSTCIAPQVLSFEPVLWEQGEIQQLPTIGGDPHGVVHAINEKGQAVGQTDNCAILSHGVLWRSGRATDLGTIGGLQPNPMDINNQSQLVGVAFSSTTFLAFLWQNGVAITLGVLPGDVGSVAMASIARAK